MRIVIATMVVVAVGASTAGAQTPDARRAPAASGAESAQTPPRVREARYQVGQMERLLEGAVEHGATVIRDRLTAGGLMQADMLLTENARARGFRLDGYGIFFDVEVPSLAGTLAWSFRTLDQNDLGLDAALATLRAYVQQSGGNDVNVQQALKRVELQVSPTASSLVASPSAGATAVPASGVVTAAAAPRPASDPVLANPDEAYRTEIRDALIDAMLEHSRGLGLAPAEWLTVAARRTDDHTNLGIDTDARTVVLRVSGADLNAFLGGQITLDEARSRIEGRVF